MSLKFSAARRTGWVFESDKLLSSLHKDAVIAMDAWRATLGPATIKAGPIGSTGGTAPNYATSFPDAAGGGDTATSVGADSSIANRADLAVDSADHADENFSYERLKLSLS